MGKLSEKDHLEDAGKGVTLILIWIFKQWDGEAWTGWIWIKIGMGVVVLWRWQWTCWVQTVRGI